MKNKKIHVTGIGNAIVDVIASVDDKFLYECRLDKGSMKLICEDEARDLHRKIEIKKIISGGSVANTIAGLATLGNKVAFIGKVKDDEMGNIFSSELAKLKILYRTKKAGPQHLPTASCIVLTTPDAQRTLNTFLGIAGMLEPKDMDAGLIKSSEVVYIEGYLFDQEKAYAAVKKAAGIASSSGIKIAMTLSDSYCVQRNRAKFNELLNIKTDILFANEEEIKMLFEVNDFNDAIKKCSELGFICALTRGEMGSTIVYRNDVIKIEPEKVAIIDSTGAGDMYAAGFLNSYLRGRDIYTCGRAGSIIAADIVSQYGARSDKDLLEILSSKGI
ncbi:MAG: adenosine kinase [Actinobacteria bacterium]|nr:adenosine kinase [Actinomycetota bacterium]